MEGIDHPGIGVEVEVHTIIDVLLPIEVEVAVGEVEEEEEVAVRIVVVVEGEAEVTIVGARVVGEGVDAIVMKREEEGDRQEIAMIAGMITAIMT